MNCGICCDMGGDLQPDVQHTAWNPGVSSTIPHDLLWLETLRRSEHVYPCPQIVEDFARLAGLAHEEFVMFRPARLALHEVVVRVTADIVVPEGDTEETFGRNFRRIAVAIADEYVAPRMGELERLHEALYERIGDRIRAVLDSGLDERPERAWSRAFPLRLFCRSKAELTSSEAPMDIEYNVLAGFKSAGLAASDPLDGAVFRGLYRILGAVLAARGWIARSERSLLATLVQRHVCNEFGARMIGEASAPHIETAIDRLGYKRVPTRARPVLVSLKGASAAGKSSIRPMVKRLMVESGIEPDGYATISPDVWRRLLLDFDSLGSAGKYAGHLTSREVMVIDAKLDHYIREKADRARTIPHLLVDRFRFDSFSTQGLERRLQATYTRYVSIIHMYFIVTPPEVTVERGWQRALERGRFKAVEDFLGHCVEAYSGMPRVLFRWIEDRNVDYRYYFLDNRVPKGQFPIFVASGDRQHMKIFDPECLVNINRYQKIKVDARCAEAVYPVGSPMDTPNNISFLRECVRRIPMISLFDGQDGPGYLEARNGTFRILDQAAYEKAMTSERVAKIISEIAPDLVKAARSMWAAELRR